MGNPANFFINFKLGGNIIKDMDNKHFKLGRNIIKDMVNKHFKLGGNIIKDMDNKCFCLVKWIVHKNTQKLDFGNKFILPQFNPNRLK